MLRVKPFTAIRPDPTVASQVASPPYDVVSEAEARALAADQPRSFIRVVRPEVDLPPGADLHSDPVYAAAAANLRRMQDEGLLIRDETHALYIYRQVMNHRSQVGVVACCHIDDYLNDVIRKHEKTRQDKEDDRTRHVLETNANAGPVFLTYRDQDEINHLVDRDMNARPLYHFVSPDGVTHTVWPVADPDAYVRAFAKLPAAYVADGHHRSASAARAGAARREQDPDPQPDAEYNWFLTVLFPASQLRILAYNRLVKDLNGLAPADVWAKLAELGTLTPTLDPTPHQPGSFCFYMKGDGKHGEWRRLDLDPDRINPDDPVGSLDVALLQELILTPILGVGDPRTDERISFVGGIRGVAALSAAVEKGDASLAVSMYPTSIEQLIAVSDAGQIMPPKSTWFEPKLRSGLFVHALD